MGRGRFKKVNIFVMDQEWEYVYFPLKMKEAKDRKMDYYFTLKKELKKPQPYPTSQSMERKAALNALLNWPTEKASELQAQTSPW